MALQSMAESKFPRADDAATQIGTLYRCAKMSQLESIRALHECGRLLRLKREMIPHGGWTLWVKDNQEMLGFNEQTARRLMNLANQSLTTDMTEEEATALSRQVWGNVTEVPPTVPDPFSTHYRRITGFLDWISKHSVSDIPDAELIELKPRIELMRQWLAELEGKAKRLNLRLAG